ARYGIKVNTVAPLAWTRLTEDVLPPDFEERLRPEFVAPVVLYLCSEECPVTGRIYNAGAGYFSRAAVVSGRGTWLGDEGEVPTLEEVAARWPRITSLQAAKEYPNANAALMDMLTPKPDIEPEVGEPGEKARPAGMGSVAEVFDRMAEFFQPDRAGGVNMVFQFTISGPGGGEWHAVVEGETCTVASGAHASPTTTLEMSDEDFLKYIGGQLPAMQAYTSGRLKIEGDLMKSQLIERLFKF
ncbi:MAG TPA: short-chain dehydrogenase, partial [Chloroflexi bacterium]|nr:short-chain dehydrogenase [Chloroflexota bacterium]